MGDKAEIHVITEFEAVATSVSDAVSSMFVHPSGRFTIETLTGFINNPMTGIPLIGREKLSEIISNYIDENNWQNLSVKQIADYLIEDIEDLLPKQRQNLRELKLKLTSIPIDDKDLAAEAEAPKTLQRPVSAKPLVLV